jgi:hypothetical protein
MVSWRREQPRFVMEPVKEGVEGLGLSCMPLSLGYMAGLKGPGSWRESGILTRVAAHDDVSNQGKWYHLSPGLI